MIVALVGCVWGMTLEEAVARAREVDAYTAAAELEWRVLQMEAAERWSALGLSPEVTLERRWTRNAVAEQGEMKVTTGVLNAPLWFDALEQSAQARSGRRVAEATALDAQYAAAVLYFEALAGESLRDAATFFRDEAERTLATTRARVTAGLDSPLMLRAAEVQAMEARAALARAESTALNARARLSRAVGQEVGELTPTRVAPPPAEPARSPWIASYTEQAAAARFERAQSWSELLPSAELSAEAPLGGGPWTVALQGTWTFDGLGPVFRARAAALAAKQAEVLADGLQRDHDLGVATGREDARSLAEVVAWAREREALAAESLAEGQARLGVGLLDTLDVIELQEDVVKARVDRVEAELEEAYVVLEARRLAGIPW